jgi:hypothetical protein
MAIFPSIQASKGVVKFLVMRKSKLFAEHYRGIRGGQSISFQLIDEAELYSREEQ